MTQKINYDQIAPGNLTPFYTSPGAPAAPATRGTRAFFGLAKDHGMQTDGSVTGGSWLQSFDSTGTVTPVDAWDYFEDLARVTAVNDFGIAISGASRNRGMPGLGLTAVVAADDATHAAWGAYIDAVRIHASAGSVNGAEIEASQIAGTSPGNAGITEFWRKGKTPYKAPVPGEVASVLIGAGSDAAAFGRSYAADAAINIGNNGGAFWTGLNFRFDALMREGVADDRTSPGNVGYARAISLATEQGISFYSRDPSGAPGSGTQEEAVRFFSNVTDHDHRSSLSFANGGMTYRDRSGAGHGIFTTVYNANVSAGLRVIPGYSGSPAVVIEAHSETGGNANFIARGAGTGIFGFGSWTASADAAVNGYVTIVDAAGNTRKLATIA